jgi:hypothetical protein
VTDLETEGASEATVTANGAAVTTRASRLRRANNTVRIAPLSRSGEFLYTWV